VLVSQETFCSK